MKRAGLILILAGLVSLELRARGQEPDADHSERRAVAARRGGPCNSRAFRTGIGAFWSSTASQVRSFMSETPTSCSRRRP